MTVANPVKAIGTTLKQASTVVGNLNSIAGLELSAETIDVTALDSTGGYKTFISGVKDAGEVKLQGNFTSDNFTLFHTSFDAGSSLAYTIEFPDKGTTTGSQWVFNAIVVKVSTGADASKAVSFDVTLKVVGQPTFNLPA